MDVLRSVVCRGVAFASVLSGTAYAAQDIKPAAIEPGVFVKVVREYDSDADKFSNEPHKGEGEACFQIVSVSGEGAKLKHISGKFKPWWSDDTYAPGTYHDTWFTSEAYLENHPEADVLDELKFTFGNVNSC